MIFIVFEAGSRAGLSAKHLFLHHLAMSKDRIDQMMLVDRNVLFWLLDTDTNRAGYITEDDFHEGISKHHLADADCFVFPADELTRQRQCIDLENKLQVHSPIWHVEPEWYDKVRVNHELANLFYQKGDGKCFLITPPTAIFRNACVKPATQSAGSKGISFHENVCVSEKIDIAREYVIDVLRRDDGYAAYFGRKVDMKNGYDQYICFLDDDHPAIARAKYLVDIVEGTPLRQLFNGIFHLQLAEDHDGQFYYIEASKRISGTSLVNIPFGYDPFVFIKTGAIIKTKPTDIEANPNRWYRYDDLFAHVVRKTLAINRAL